MEGINSKNKKITMAGALIVFLALAGFGASHYFFSDDKAGIAADSEANKFSDIIIKIKPLEPEILSSAKFIKLKEYQVRRPSLDELKIGKKNPFEPSE